MRTRSGKWRLLAAALASCLALTAAPFDQPTEAAAAVLAGPNLAAGKSASASSSTQNYLAANVTDGNQATYWESANNAFYGPVTGDTQAPTAPGNQRRRHHHDVHGHPAGQYVDYLLRPRERCRWQPIAEQ